MARAVLLAAVAGLGAGFFIQSGRLAVTKDRMLEMAASVADIRIRLHAFWDDQMEELDDEDEWASLALLCMHDIGILIVESPWGAALDDVYGELDYDLPFEINDEEEDADDL